MAESTFRLGSYKQAGPDSARNIILAALLCAALIALVVGTAGLGRVDFVTVGLVVVIVGLVAFSAWLVVRSGPLDPFHPLLYSAWFYLLPMSVIKPIYLAIGNYSPYLSTTNNPQYYLHLALLYVIVGWAALIAGFHLPFVTKIGEKLRCPSFLRADLSRIPVPFAAFGIGLIFVLILIVEHAYGASLSLAGGNGSVVSVALPFSTLTSMALFLLVYGPPGKKPAVWKWCLVVVVTLTLLLGLISGSRANLSTVVILMAAAYAFSKRDAIPWRRLVPWFLAAGLVLLITTLIATQYRLDRQSEYGSNQISFPQTVDLLQQSAGQASTLGIAGGSSSAFGTIINRLDSIDLLGSTLAQAPHVKVEERQVGIDNNIEKEMFWEFVPRLLDPGKPVFSNFGLWFSRIYRGSSSLDWSGPSAFGDLYRNFGNIGVVVGMLVVGAYFRLLYDILVRQSDRKPLAVLLYFFLLTSMNWESEYASWFTTGLQMFVVVVVLWVLLRHLGGLVSPEA